MIRFSCPKCQMILQAATEQAGATVACPRCKFQMQVPSAAPVAKVAPQPAGPALDSLGDVRASQGAAQHPPAGAPTFATPGPAPWYFTRDGKKYGPYTTAQLKQYADTGQLLATDLVWKEGMEGWKPASAVKGLFATQQPPSQPTAQAQPSGSPGRPFESLATPAARRLTKAKQRWHGLSPKVKLGIIGGAVAVPLVLVLVAVLVIAGRSGRGGGPAAQDGGDKNGNKGTGKARSGSFAERAMQAKGLKERPAHLKPQQPGSTDDFIDALVIFGCEPSNPFVEPKRLDQFPAGGYQVVRLFPNYDLTNPSKWITFLEDEWIEVFGEPEKLKDGHSKGVPFQRWKYVLTDGPVTLHGFFQDRKCRPTVVCMY